MIDQIIATVRKLAADSPNNVYSRPGGIDSVCKYFSGKCSNGSTGCIFGQAFLELELDIDEDIDEDFGMGIVALLDIELNIEEEYHKKNWCDKVQRVQDSELSWSEAIKRADEMYPLEKV